MLIDALDARVREIALASDPACALHGASRSIFDVVEEAVAAPLATGVPEIGADELDDFLRETPGALLLDVREPHEAVLGRFTGSLDIAASQLEARLHELDTSRTYVVACRIGQTSRWAAQRLHEAGFRRLRHLHGGLLAYGARNAAFDVF
jgi:adenylyltransferase/sulfurtransferase